MDHCGRVLNAAVFLFHFRVAGYYMPLLIITVLYEMVLSRKNKTFATKMLVNVGVVGTLSIILISPVLIPSINSYIERTQKIAEVANYKKPSPQKMITSDTTSKLFMRLARENGWSYSSSLAPFISLIGFPKFNPRRNNLDGIIMGGRDAYRLGIPVLNFTNYTAIMIMYYIPIGLLLGMAGEGILKYNWLKYNAVNAAVLVILVGLGIISARQRIKDIEPFRFFVTPADVEAMAWIRANTTEEAVFGINTLHVAR